MQIRPRRSVLYMPGSNARALEKAKTLAADGSSSISRTPLRPKPRRRRATRCATPSRRAAMASASSSSASTGSTRRGARPISPPPRPCGARRHPAAQARRPAPTSRAPRRRMASAGAPDKTRLWAMIETPLAILNLARDRRRRAQHRRAARLLRHGHQRPRQGDARRPVQQPAPGAVLAVGRPSRRRAPTASTCSTASTTTSRTPTASPRVRAWPRARLRRQDADPPRPGRRRQRGVRAAARRRWPSRARSSPPSTQPESEGKGVITVDGRMVELLHAEMARRTVAIAEAIADA